MTERYGRRCTTAAVFTPPQVPPPGVIPAIELTGEEGAEEAEYRINEMRYYRTH